jgi:hypothetical protein
MVPVTEDIFSPGFVTTRLDIPLFWG